MTKSRARSEFILCIDDTDCADLVKRKVYTLLPDAKAKRVGFVRVTDESGEDYLYPEAKFVAVELPPAAVEALRATS